MNDEDVLDDRALAGAFRSVRDAYDGTNEASNLTLQRALFRTRVRERKQRFTRWILLPAAAMLVAGTAWAGVTGRLAPALDGVKNMFEDEPAAPPAAPGEASRKAPPAPADPLRLPAGSEPTANEAEVHSEVPAPPPVVEVPAAPQPIVRAVHSTPSSPRSSEDVSTPEIPDPPPAAPSDPSAAAPSDPSAAAPSDPSAAAPSDPSAALFAEAHRIHFAERDPARALVAWDRYLAAAPNGRFVPEARYNRALALVRLGRRVEAEKELSAFASGAYGAYRREDAKALLDALTRTAR